MTTPNPETPDSPPITPKPLIPDAEGALRAWGKFFVGLSILHYILGIGGTLLATAVAAKAAFFDASTMSVLAWLSAVCVGLLTLLAPLKRAKLYHTAWNHLGDVYRRYRYTAAVSADEVLDAIKAGEDMVGKFFDF